MIIRFFEFLYGRTFDEGTTPPRWLRALTRRNRRLGEFADATGQVDAMLRNSALELRQAMASDQAAATITLPPERTVTQEDLRVRSTTSVRWFVVAGVTAVVMLVMIPSLSRRSKPPVHAGDFSQQLTMVPGEVLRVINRAAETSQTQLPQLSPLGKLRVPTLPNWQAVTAQIESPVQREIDAWQSGWQNLRSRFSDETREL
ncbi:MAG: hypothetical protein AAGD11_13575 [Planctomycetota bacterium]